jgi:hypothetical protein
MESSCSQEQGSGRIAAALLTTLKRLSDVQESQKRIEEQTRKATDDLYQYGGRLGNIEEKESDQYDIMAHNSKVLTERLESIDGNLKSIRKTTSAIHKNPVRWKHHLRAGGLLLGALGIGLVVGWLWALTWLRVDETERMALGNERMSIENQRSSLDAERDVGHAVMVNYGYADEERRDLIKLLISSEEMSSNQRKRIWKWLEARSGKSSGRKAGK